MLSTSIRKRETLASHKEDSKKGILPAVQPEEQPSARGGVADERTAFEQAFAYDYRNTPRGGSLNPAEGMPATYDYPQGQLTQGRERSELFNPKLQNDKFQRIKGNALLPKDTPYKEPNRGPDYLQPDQMPDRFGGPRFGSNKAAWQGPHQRWHKSTTPEQHAAMGMVYM